ncbi:double-strand break repair helicase AddA [Sinorhizobium meliloti]|uniref:double-strand break repair helicase AddA n=1 Tax=Rhizobium meliloti TaxID=382 RepID=UPI000FD6DF6B|nr:double-strand break repair helicase AddA [Sinorhizobium meliloti]MDE3826890.1 double-strand break repair helicase AddA [Sinorhizobium meliloti]RVM52418.1 double-strand break repair helicase AddA [Sinorhizobium meliloti]RVN73745.1 double-strand break repair helicase AddA [Sinorhizobium meliloti]
MRSDATGPEERSPEGWLDWTTQRQALASDPARSAWVSANAGSGKTHVLTQRVIRLLLAGCRPSAILCLTYTKAAASEMSNRVFEKLAEWATLDDTTLEKRIEAIEGKRPPTAKIQEARRLFARALETPGGLKIQTIHAFCEALLHQFPLEANVAGHFSVLDDRAAAVLLADARRALLTATAAASDGELAEAFATVLDLADDTGLEKLLAAIVANRAPIQAFLDHASGRGGMEAHLRAALGLEPGETAGTVMAAVWPLAGLNGPALDDYIDLGLRLGGAKPSAIADGLRAVRAIEDAATRYAKLVELFFNGGGKPKAESAFLNAAMRRAAPQLELRVEEARSHMLACVDRLSIVQMYGATRAALILAERLNRDYEALKKARSQLDFEDLINRTAALLARSDVGAWVHYKLDQGIDHILVDEAQDTSPAQWTIIQSLAADFFAGETARADDRTIFAVGDEKQSIYSFQGARPERFSRESTLTERRVRAGNKHFSPIRLQLSFRSTVDVLSAVDTVFANSGNARGLSARSEAIVHASNRIGQPGAVDLWDVIAPEPAASEEDWTAPFDATPERAPVNILARRIAAVLEDWIGRETVIEKGVRRAMRPGDVIVLVRKRDAFVNALTRALKRRGNIPVAGADRLVLTSHIAVQDLIALGRFVLLPEDDLSLAALLKSPLLDLGEEDVFELAARRTEGESLWRRLRQAGAEETSRYHEAVRTLSRYSGLARELLPHDFYARVLGADGGRRAFLARLGSEVSDILDEFLTFALDHERNGLPGLQAFISTLEIEAPTVKREQDKERDEVRVMTVHAAKGLEAPVVFLVDGGGEAFVRQQVSDLRFLEKAQADHSTLTVPVWRAPGSAPNSLIAADNERLKKLAEEEYRRLLYVGMTRAADRLIVCGYRGQRQNTDTWHSMVQGTLAQDLKGRGTPRLFRAGSEEWQGIAWREAHVPRDLPTSEGRSEESQRPTAGLPTALFTPPAAPRRLPRPLAPSGTTIAIDDPNAEAIVGSALFAGKSAPKFSMLRGAILHRLLQVLPSVDPRERLAAAERYLARSVPRWPEAERRALAGTVMDVLDHADLQPLFGEHSRAEVSVMGTLKLGVREFAVSGRIDRLAVTGDMVTIADYKTNREIPETPEEIAPVYRNQLAIYRELLKPLYPGKRFRCVLIFTEGPAIRVLPEPMLDRSLEELATK